VHVWQVGSAFLGRRVEELQPSLHVFGHTHFSWDATLDGVRYIQAPLCYPQERSSRGRSIAIGPDGGMGAGPLQLWDGTELLPLQRMAHWSAYYRQHKRTPENTTELAPYVASRYKRIGPKVRCTACGGSGSYKDRGSCRMCDSTGRV